MSEHKDNTVIAEAVKLHNEYKSAELKYDDAKNQETALKNVFKKGEEFSDALDEARIRPQVFADTLFAVLQENDMKLFLNDDGMRKGYSGEDMKKLAGSVFPLTLNRLISNNAVDSMRQGIIAENIADTKEKALADADIHYKQNAEVYMQDALNSAQEDGVQIKFNS